MSKTQLTAEVALKSGDISHLRIFDNGEYIGQASVRSQYVDALLELINGKPCEPKPKDTNQ